MTSKTEQFIHKAHQLHSNKYDYSLTEYLRVSSKIKIICPIHGIFEMRPGDHIHNHQGCRICSDIAKKNTTETFIKKAQTTHGLRYDYSLVDYIHNKVPVSIICKEHGIFFQKPNDHINGTNCPNCANNKTHNVVTFIKKATNIHGTLYDYSNVIYINGSQKVNIVCPKHGSFLQTPQAHLYQKQGCPRCKINNFSVSSIKWLEQESNKLGYYIQHALNDGEYLIPNTKLKADGYCKENNTIYEFWGDFWHGNPKIYNPTQLNKVKQITFGELYNQTQHKRQLILTLGYPLVEIWESEWNLQQKEKDNE